MPFDRSRAEQNQRTDVIDFVRTNDQAYANLTLLARHFIAQDNGIVRGGALEPTTIPSMAVIVKTPLAAMTSGGLVLIETDQTLALAAANPTNPRIDLVSVGYAEAETGNEQRIFINPATGQTSQTPVNTLVRATPDLRVTTGVPAATPAVPAPPAGHIPLWQVRVNAAATSVVMADFTRANPRGRAPDFQIASFPLSGTDGGPTWTSAELLKALDTPTGAITLLVGSLYFSVPAGQGGGMITLSIEATVGGRVGRTEFLHADNAELLAPRYTMHVFGAVTGPRIDTYKLQLHRTLLTDVTWAETDFGTPSLPILNHLMALTIPVRL